MGPLHKMGNLHIVAKALARTATISNVSSALCVLFSPIELLKKSRPYSSPSTSKQSKETVNCSLPPAKRPLIFNYQTLQADETNDKNQNIPHDLHITRQPYPLLELAVKDTSVMLSTLQNFYCLIDQ